jgi:hypothetical protein
MSFEIDIDEDGLSPFGDPNEQPPYVEESRRRFSGLSCALIMLAFLFAGVLVGLGLLLPPFSLGDQLLGAPYTSLNAAASSTTLDGLTFTIDAANPGRNYGVRIKSIPAYSASDSWTIDAYTALASNLTVLSPLYRIDQRGNSPETIQISVPVPADTESGKLDMVGYDGKYWQFMPAIPSGDGTSLVAEVKTVPPAIALVQSARLVPVISVVIEPGESLIDGMIAVANVIHPAGLHPIASGALEGALPAGLDAGRGYAIVPVIRNFVGDDPVDVQTVVNLLQDPTLRGEHVELLAQFALSKPYQGLAIDYRELPADQRENVSAFITSLSRRLHDENLTLTVVVPFPEQGGSGFTTGAYDWRVIGDTADTVQVMLPLNPQSFVSVADSILQWATDQISRAKLQIVLSTRSVQDEKGVLSPITYAEALQPLGRITLKSPNVIKPGEKIEVALNGDVAQLGLLDSSNAPSIKYFDTGGMLLRTVWLTTPGVVNKRLERLWNYNVAGIVLPDVGTPDAAARVVDLIAAYKVNRSTGIEPTALSLRWVVLIGDTVLAEQIGDSGTGTSSSFVYETNERQQNSQIQIRAELVGAQSILGAVTVQVTKPDAG